MSKRPFLLAVVIVILIVVAAFAGWLYFRGAPEPQVSDERATGPLLIPQALVSPLTNPEWSFAGIVQKIDTTNKFLDLKTAPLFPASFAQLGFEDSIRIHFDGTTKVFVIIVGTENGVALSFQRDTRRQYDISALRPGTAVRINGVHSTGQGNYSAKIISIFEYHKQ